MLTDSQHRHKKLVSGGTGCWAMEAGGSQRLTSQPVKLQIQRDAPFQN